MTDDHVQSFLIGDVEVLRIVEWRGPYAPAADLVPDCGPDVWRAHADALVPEHLEPGGGRAVVALQTWVLRSGGRTVLVDTGVGNGRERPGNPLFHRREGDFLGRLERAGIRPRDVDVVINTHLHADHVGWNTVDADGEWVPAFPRARYLLPAADDRHFGPAGGYGGGTRPVDRLVYEDSVAPVHRAGQTVLWEDTHRIDEHLVLEAAPGHTPGSGLLRVESGGERAVFVGDLLHSPVQILRPECSSCFCLDPGQAARTRERVLERAAEERALVVPAHFGGAGAVEVRRASHGFRPHRWAA
ncbi:MBL fold metallo-hydrolase [Streptomyces echinatus]|uniref:Glyoxylase-like metal-dependent hydrolase (Beta-lactamase superfamily II) n=1 Tax=Streptomyces echinatus TaxID=67293 RepID=A0A7W9PT42_9ACTN|nr:MBL fold metallo-hydrolase [Streptomyces echinatus]MBB5927365.1 glyoxylase-like metal-dependent hydrolase (beta-lactamase superfamily II) [Streptomyces echinatus]